MFYLRYNDRIVFSKNIYTNYIKMNIVPRIDSDGKLFIPNGESDYHIAARVLLAKDLSNDLLPNVENMVEVKDDFVGILVTSAIDYCVYYNYDNVNKHRLNIVPCYAMSQVITGHVDINVYLKTCMEILKAEYVAEDKEVDKDVIIGKIAYLYNEMSAFGVDDLVCISTNDLHEAIYKAKDNEDRPIIPSRDIDIVHVTPYREIVKMRLDSLLTPITNVTSKKKRNKKVKQHVKTNTEDNVSA